MFTFVLIDLKFYFEEEVLQEVKTVLRASGITSNRT
jgi:hypothetical protein